MIHEKHVRWLEDRHIDPVLAEKLGLKTVTQNGAAWLSFPFIERGQEVNHQRRLTSQKDFRMDDGAELTLWNHDVLLDPKVQSGEQAVIVTEGMMDGIAAIQSGFQYVVSVPNGAPAKASDDPFDTKRYEYLHRLKPLWDKVGTFILCGDGDDPGQALNQDLARILGPWRCKFVRYGADCKDLGDTLSVYGEEVVRYTIDNAMDWPVNGLYKFSEIPDEPQLEGITLGVPGLGKLFQLVPGTFSVLTGYAGSGKTSLLMSVFSNLLRDGVPIVSGSFETRPSILKQKMRASLMRTATNRLTPEEITEADAILERGFSNIIQLSQDEDEDMDLTRILDLAATAVIRQRAKLLVIDPWNEIEHKRRKGESETDYTGRAIQDIKRFSRSTDCAVWMVAHPSKPFYDKSGKMPPVTLYGISGSAHWANKADYGLVISRVPKTPNEIDVDNKKVRMGLPGEVGSVRLAYNFHTSTYDIANEESDND